jgi:hypothetical protein
MQPKPPIFSLPIRDCTAEQLASLGLGGYRLLASNGTDAVFSLQPMLDLTPPDVKAAIENANAAAIGVPMAAGGG